MSAPRATVLIGTWNSARTVRRAVESVLAQTVEDLELIVVDDGSTDETRDVVAAIPDPRVRLLAREHEGISGSLNAGLRAARSDAVAILDADDWMLPERLERQVAVLEAEPDVAVVGCRMREVDRDGRPFGRARFGRGMDGLHGDVTAALMRFNPMPNTATTVRRSAVLAAGGYDPRYRYAMEYDLWLRLAERHRLVLLPDELAVREMGGANVAATRERAQVGETVRLKLAAMARRRSVRGARGLVHPVASYVTPLPVKRWNRRRRGQAP